MNIWERKGDNNPTAQPFPKVPPTTINIGIDMDYDKNASCQDNSNEQRVQEVLLFYAYDYETKDYWQEDQ